MYIKNLRIQRVKRIRELELDFDDGHGAPRKLTVIIGENGTAKTSILHAIALAATGSAQVNGLARDIVGHLRDRRSDEMLEVRASFVASDVERWKRSPNTDTLPALLSQFTLARDETLLAAKDFMFDAPSPAQIMRSRFVHGLDPCLNEARSKNEPGYFVAAYGVSRFLPSPAASPELTQPALERLEPLFRSSVQLTAFRFADHFEPERARVFASELNRVLEDGIVPGVDGLELRGRGGVRQAGDLLERDRIKQRFGGSEYKLPAVALAHGYQSTLAWISDVYGHYMLEHGGVPTMDEVRGLVLIDEIDLYLHPRWQRTLIPALRRALPNVQFVVTTHSPAVLANVAPNEIVMLGQDATSGDIMATTFDPVTEAPHLVSSTAGDMHLLDPRVMTGSEIYERFFGMDPLTQNAHGEMLRRLYRLATDPYRNDDQDAEAKLLTDTLRSAGLNALPELAPRENVAAHETNEAT